MRKLLLLLFLATSVQVFAGIPLSTNFTVNTALPIDDRLSVADTTARDALSSLRRWEGMLVYVIAEGKHYTLVGGITNGDWTELSGSGSGGGISGWLTATPYVIGDVVIESDRIYVCKADHTSGTFATDLAANWTELSQSENLTGPIASTGGVTSITSQTGTGTTFVVDTSPTLITPNIGAATATSINGSTIPTSKTLVVTTDKINVLASTSSSELAGVISDETGTNKLVYSDSPTLVTPDIGAATGTSITLTDKMLSGYQTPDNMIKNGDVELTDITMFTCGASNTCARTTTAGEYSKGLAALKVTTAAAAVNASQSVTTPSGIQKQGYVRLLYRIPATITDAQICSTVDAAEQNCVPSSKLINNGLYNQIEIPLIFGTTSAGWKIKTTATYTQDVFIDNVILAQGLGTQNLMLDNVYSAQVSIDNPGTVTRENTDFISGSCARSGTSNSTATCIFNSDVFTVAPNCTAQTVYAASTGAFAYSVVSTNASVTVSVADATNSPKAEAFTLICQKSGNDYLASSANVYSSTNGNTDWVSYTPITPNSSFSATTALTNPECLHKREGSDLLIRCKFTSGTTQSQEARISLPSGLVSADSTKIPSISIAGFAASGSAATTFFHNTVLIEPSVTYFTFGHQSSTSGDITKANGNAVVGSATLVSFHARIPISGWSNSNVIVGSFAGYVKVPGAENLNVEKVIISYGNTISTVCTSANGVACPYIDQLGSGASVTHGASVGVYNILFPRTYAKAKCFFSPAGATPQVVYSTTLSCSSCSTLSFISEGTATTAPTDSYGNIDCTGVY